jgi:hypothetical protein
MARNPASGPDAPLNEQETTAVLYLATVNAQAIAKPSKEQRALGLAAAQSLAEILPRYFDDGRRPPWSSSEQWADSRKQLDAAAREAVKKLGGRPGA